MGSRVTITFGSKMIMGSTKGKGSTNEHEYTIGMGSTMGVGSTMGAWGQPWALSSVFCRDTLSMDPKASDGNEEEKFPSRPVSSKSVKKTLQR